MNAVLQYWPVVVFVAVVYYIALFEADKDAFAIEAHLKIDHAAGWCRRAVGIMVPAGIVCLALPSWWCILPLLSLGAFLFSLVFRLRLNALRGKHWAYIAPWSNVYDRVFYALASLYWARRDTLELDAKWYAKGDFKSVTSDVHRAGHLAYLTEITLSVLSLVVIGAIMNKNLP